MKSYTDLPQSKKLAEILPLESADMKWYFWKSEIDAPKLPTFGYSKDAAENYKSTEAVYLPCWSLAALLGVLPKTFSYNNHAYQFMYNTRAMFYINVDNYDEYTFCSTNENLVDACVGMIIKLKELNLL